MLAVCHSCELIVYLFALFVCRFKNENKSYFKKKNRLRCVLLSKINGIARNVSFLCHKSVLFVFLTWQIPMVTHVQHITWSAAGCAQTFD